MPKLDHAYLLSGLVALLVAGPLLSQALPDQAALPLFRLIFLATMVLQVWSLRRRERGAKPAVLLALLIVLLTIAELALPGRFLRLASAVAMLAFLLLTTLEVGANIFGSGQVGLNRLLGAVCLYLMLGVMFALVYGAVLDFVPGAIRGIDGDNGSFWDLVYFSFVTMTTLGYGDMAPVSPVTRALAYLEAILGQFYLAIMVAALVGLYLSGHSGDSHDGS